MPQGIKVSLHQLYYMPYFESQESLDQSDIRWLRRHELVETLWMYFERQAVNFENQFKITHDLWDAVKASSCWRNANQPRKALELTEQLLNRPSRVEKKVEAALLTTRGGAFRDIEELDQAETCGLEAIGHNPNSYYPYNLLGAIYYQTGVPEKGDKYFTKAVELGAEPRLQDSEIMDAVERAGLEEKKVVANYLLNKDPIKYKWAERYLANNQ